MIKKLFYKLRTIYQNDQHFVKIFFRSTEKFYKSYLKKPKNYKMAIPLQKNFYSQKGKKVNLYAVFYSFFLQKKPKIKYLTRLVSTIEKKLEMVYCMHKK